MFFWVVTRCVFGGGNINVSEEHLPPSSRWKSPLEMFSLVNEEYLENAVCHSIRLSETVILQLAQKYVGGKNGG